MTARSTRPVAEPVALPAWEEGLSLDAITAGMTVEFTNLRLDTPANQRKCAGVWKVTEIVSATRGRRASVKVTNSLGSTLRGVSPDMLKASALPWPQVENVAMPHAGGVVRFTEAGAKRVRGVTPADLFVVLKVKGDDVSLARLGGVDGGRYFPSIPRTLLAEVHGETVTIP
jgi:hypothetical protein